MPWVMSSFAYLQHLFQCFEKIEFKDSRSSRWRRLLWGRPGRRCLCDICPRLGPTGGGYRAPARTGHSRMARHLLVKRIMTVDNCLVNGWLTVSWLTAVEFQFRSCGEDRLERGSVQGGQVVVHKSQIRFETGCNISKSYSNYWLEMTWNDAKKTQKCHQKEKAESDSKWHENDTIKTQNGI